MLAATVVNAIGDTPLVALRRLAPGSGARVLVEVEGGNPTGSMKDRSTNPRSAAARAPYPTGTQA